MFRPPSCPALCCAAPAQQCALALFVLVLPALEFECPQATAVLAAHVFSAATATTTFHLHLHANMPALHRPLLTSVATMLIALETASSAFDPQLNSGRPRPSRIPRCWKRLCEVLQNLSVNLRCVLVCARIHTFNVLCPTQRQLCHVKRQCVQDQSHYEGSTHERHDNGLPCRRPSLYVLESVRAFLAQSDVT